MSFDRRNLVSAAGLGLVTGLGMTVAARASSPPAAAPRFAAVPHASVGDLGLSLEPGHDAGPVLQAAIDQAAGRGVGLRLPPGNYAVRRSLRLRPGTALSGALGMTRLVLENGAVVAGENCPALRIESLTLDGANVPLDNERAARGLLTLSECANLSLTDLELRDSHGNGLVLKGCSGWISGCHVHRIRRAAIFSLDGRGLEIAHNQIQDCGDNGILVWTSRVAECGTTVLANRIERIAATSGGSGQYGNGINVFRATGVLVANNRISDCAYTAIRGNAASNIQMIANSCARLGEVALYAEFSFEGALIANNLVETAAAGISVTNFNEGGRLAVVQGNLIRNLSRREHEPEDKRGEAIAVEADSVVAGNVVENAPTAGIFIGWGAHMREVSATGNLVRNVGFGIAVQANEAMGGLRGLIGGSAGVAAGNVLIANNMISGARHGAIRTLRHHTAFGADLARSSTSPFAHIACLGNIAT